MDKTLTGKRFRDKFKTCRPGESENVLTGEVVAESDSEVSIRMDDGEIRKFSADSFPHLFEEEES